MNDPKAGQYSRHYRNEFMLAQQIIDGFMKEEAGIVEWSSNDYEAFHYVTPPVRLIFYPHRTSAGAYHIRVRDHASKEPEHAKSLMRSLYEESGYNCTFSRKGAH